MPQDPRCPEGYVWKQTCGCGSGKCVPANQASATQVPLQTAATPSGGLFVGAGASR